MCLYFLLSSCFCQAERGNSFSTLTSGCRGQISPAKSTPTKCLSVVETGEIVPDELPHIYFQSTSPPDPPNRALDSPSQFWRQSVTYKTEITNKAANYSHSRRAWLFTRCIVARNVVFRSELETVISTSTIGRSDQRFDLRAARALFLKNSCRTGGDPRGNITR